MKECGRSTATGGPCVRRRPDKSLGDGWIICGKHGICFHKSFVCSLCELNAEATDV